MLLFPAMLIQFASGTKLPSCSHYDEPRSGVVNEQNLWADEKVEEFNLFFRSVSMCWFPISPFWLWHHHSASKTIQACNVFKKEQMKGWQHETVKGLTRLDLSGWQPPRKQKRRLAICMIIVRRWRRWQAPLLKTRAFLWSQLGKGITVNGRVRLWGAQQSRTLIHRGRLITVRR